MSLKYEPASEPLHIRAEHQNTPNHGQCTKWVAGSMYSSCMDTFAPTKLAHSANSKGSSCIQNIIRRLTESIFRAYAKWICPCMWDCKGGVCEAQTLVSLSFRLKDLPGPVTRVKKEEEQGTDLAARISTASLSLVLTLSCFVRVVNLGRSTCHAISGRGD